MKSREWSITEPFSKYNFNLNFIDGFECYVCKRLHLNKQRKINNLETHAYQATVEHYGCPVPRSYNQKGQYKKLSSWEHQWEQEEYVAKAVRYFIDNNLSYNEKTLRQMAKQLRQQDGFR